jgi:hypothetical protein
MLQQAITPITKVRNSVLRFGLICSAIYIVFFLLMAAFGLAHVTALRVVNYVVLWAVCFYGIKKWMSRSGGFMPFLTVFGITFFTGIFSFLLLSVFLFLYSRFNDSFASMISPNVPAFFREYPSVLVFCEGASVSIIVGFINMQYFRRYEEGEAEVKKDPHSREQAQK